MTDEDEFTFGRKGPRNLTDFDPTKIRTHAETDTLTSFVLVLVAHVLFLGGLALVVVMWWMTGRRDG
jgi:hypothetical protein